MEISADSSLESYSGNNEQHLGSESVLIVDDSDVESIYEPGNASDSLSTDADVVSDISVVPDPEHLDDMDLAANEDVGPDVANNSDTEEAGVPVVIVEEERPATPIPPALPRTSSLTPYRDSLADFRSPKKRKLMSPEKGKENSPSEEDEEGQICPICFDPWTNSGSHRLSSLKCGHLFGQSCIEKWLKGHGGKCPHCNAPAKKNEVRVIYAKNIKVLDTTERDRALEELEKEKENRKKTEMDAAQTRLQYQLVVEECNRLRREVDKYRQLVDTLRTQSTLSFSQPGNDNPLCSQGQRGQYVYDKMVKICEAGNCRVMAYNSSLATLVLSQPSTSPLFPGFGIKKLSSVDFRTAQYLAVHLKAIRGLCFGPNPADGILLSCALDKTIKMTSMISNTVVQSYDAPMPVWSCSWNHDDKNIIFAGLQNGSVLEFDIRNTAGYVQQLNTEGSRSPVVSLQYVNKDINAAFRPGGLLVGQLDRVNFYEKKTNGENRLHILPLEGSLTSLHFEPSTRHILASFRPTTKHPSIRHQMCELASVSTSNDPTAMDNMCTSHCVQTFHGGRTQKLLSRSLLVQVPGDESKLMACAGDESSESTHIWDAGSGYMKQKLTSAGSSVLDICPLAINNQNYLVCLTEKQIRIHKWS